MGAIYSAPPLKIEAPECSDPHFGPCSLRPSISLMPFLELTNGWVDFPGSRPLSRSSNHAGRDISEHQLHHKRKPRASESNILAVRLGVCLVASVVSDFVRNCSPPGSSVHDSPSRNIGVGCHALLQGIFLTQKWNQCLFCLLHWQAGSLSIAPLGKPCTAGRCLHIPFPWLAKEI